MSKTGCLRWLMVPLMAVCFSTAAVEAGGLRPGKKEPAYVPSGNWEGYFTNDKGLPAGPVLTPAERNKDKDWMFLRFTDYSGPKLRVAVMQVENLTATAQAANSTEAVAVTDQLAQVPVSNLEEMLATAVFNTNRFELIERKEIEQVLSEQDLGASGRVQKSTAAKTGKITGVDYMVFASVNEWTPEKSKGGGAGGGASTGGLGMIGIQKSTAEVAMSFRIVDAGTSQVVFTTIERATAGNWGFSLGGISGGEGGALSFRKASPIGYAIQSCINKGAYKLAMWLRDRPWQGDVIKVDGQRVFIGAGSSSGLTPGLELVALSLGKEIFGLNGESLGHETSVTGALRVAMVQEKYSIAEIVEGCQGLKQGDRVELRDSPAIVVTSKP